MAVQLAELETALSAGAEERVRATLEQAGVPAPAQAQILQGYEASADSPEARAQFLTELRAQFEQQAERVLAEAEAGVRASFTAAITRVFTYVLFIVAIAWLVTVFVPVLPLRETMDSASLGTEGTAAS